MPNNSWNELYLKPYKTAEIEKVNGYTIYEGKWITIEHKKIKRDFIPTIKWLPNLCRWLGLGRMVRRNKRRV